MSDPHYTQHPRAEDRRHLNFSQIDNEVMDIYAPHIGPQGIAIYLALVRFAWGDGSSYPSHESIGERSGMSARSVQKYMERLTEDNERFKANNLSPLIKVQRRFREDGGSTSNLYIILPVAKSAPPPTKAFADPPRNMPSDPPTKAFADDVDTDDKDPREEDIVAPKRKQQPLRPIPEDFFPGDNLMDWCDDNGFTREQVFDQVPQFIDNHTAKGTQMRDWSAAFRTWMRNARAWNKLTPAPGQQRMKPEYIDRHGNFTVAGAAAHARGEI